MKLILGSASDSRQHILANMGFVFEVIVANIDEKSIRHEDPRILTLALAKAKAEAIRTRVHEDALIITSDQVVVVNEVIHEKPRDLAEAESHLRKASESPPKTVTAVVVTNTKTDKQVFGVDEVIISFHPFPAEAIQKYLDTKDSLHRAGGFAVEHPLIAPYVASINGELESVRGLPVALTKKLLREAEQD